MPLAELSAGAFNSLFILGRNPDRNVQKPSVYLLLSAFSTLKPDPIEVSLALCSKIFNCFLFFHVYRLQYIFNALITIYKAICKKTTGATAGAVDFPPTGANTLGGAAGQAKPTP